MTIEPRLENTLVWHVLNDYERYLGVASPSLLAQFLYGAEERARLTGAVIPRWRIFGSLHKRDFYLPIVARTGHPTMSINWALALEMLHFSMSEAMVQLRTDLMAYVQEKGMDEEAFPASNDLAAHYKNDFGYFLQIVARRPGMWGLVDGPSFQCWLAGMNIGGDWLDLPLLPGLREMIATIEATSVEAYGSPFAGYRAFNGIIDPENLKQFLKWVGIEPLQTDSADHEGRAASV